MVHKEKFIQHVEDSFEWDREQIEAVWFKDNEGCFPSDYLGDDLMNDIINKFYAPFDYVVSIIEKEFKLNTTVMRINIMPCFEDSTYTVVHDGEKVYIADGTKAWYFWWKDEKEFDEWVDEQVNKIRSRLNPNFERVS